MSPLLRSLGSKFYLKFEIFVSYTHTNDVTAREKIWVLMGGGSVWDLRKPAPLNTICRAFMCYYRL